jgi:hypothetical protein
LNRLRVGSALKSIRIRLAALAAFAVMVIAVMVIAVVILHGATTGHRAPLGSIGASSSVSPPAEANSLDLCTTFQDAATR